MSPENKRLKVVYIISHIDKAIGFEWIAEKLDKTHFELFFVLLNDKPSYLGKHLNEKGIPYKELSVGSKKRMPIVLWQMMKILKKEKADVIHTHMYIADIIGQLAGKILRIKKRIYTRHLECHLDG